MNYFSTDVEIHSDFSSFQQMLASAVAGIASSGVAYADLSGQITQIKAEVSALSTAQTTLSSTVSTLSTSSTCLISKVCFHAFL